jgi:hypothetical protein
MSAFKYEQALELNQTQVVRKTEVDPGTFAEVKVVLHDREIIDTPTAKAGGILASTTDCQRPLGLHLSPQAFPELPQAFWRAPPYEVLLLRCSPGRDNLASGQPQRKYDYDAPLMSRGLPQSVASQPLALPRESLNRDDAPT